MDDILQLPAYECAPLILGWKLEREINGNFISGFIVETEAYDQSDAASHSFRGMTPRTKVMFGPAGHAYVYFTYGMHYCMNVVTGREGSGSAILIRALQPVEGLEIMRRNRKNASELNLTNGPAKLCQALEIDKQFNGHSLVSGPLKLIPSITNDIQQIISTTRIGITKDTHRPWRWYIAGNKFVSQT
jgi:DNA-3-methyladenine glycosylase